MAASTAPALLGDAPPYERHRPEHTPLYALVEEHFPRFLVKGLAGASNAWSDICSRRSAPGSAAAGNGTKRRCSPTVTAHPILVAV